MGKFNVLWIDDQPEKCKKEQMILKKTIQKYGLIPSIKSIRKVRKDELLKDGHESNIALTSREYDLLIIDYKLSSDLLGGEVISQVRTKYNIYTDIIFYSSAKSELIQSVKNSFDEPSSLSYLDDVYIVPLGDDFDQKIDRIVNKIVESWYNAHSIRGVILSKTSYFESLIADIIRKFYEEKLSDLKIKLKSKGDNVIKTTIGKWKAVEDKEDPIDYILDNPIVFNWSVKCMIFNYLIECGNIKLENSVRDEIQEVFNLRNDFAHNVIKIENGLCILYKNGEKVIFDTDKIKEIRNKITLIDEKLKEILKNN